MAGYRISKILSLVKLANMKSNLREAEDELVKVLAALSEYIVVFTSQLQAHTRLYKVTSQYLRTLLVMLPKTTSKTQALGFHVEAGHVKFTFTNIDAERPTREFSFTVHYGNDIYTLVDCNSQLDDMVQELNKTNDHFGFVRQMRDKFQKATLSGQEMNVELSPGITRNKLKLRCHGVLETTICCLNFI
ncbi:hypothetical protein DY000_02055496 [Brassica cretica]|uniref:Kinetochore protein SPC25 n=1 Tax=Brassica cretica TaxID=69181 RepID=A0ABQ7A5J8_BRACR|nr:hypothetical protein DY000_02055496 [Brassica cretica]